MAAHQWLLAGIGWLAVGLGVLGIFLPLLPTTPFLLLALWCFARSSERFHQWLLEHPTMGPIVGIWEDGRGIPKRVRNRVLLIIWVAMLVSMLMVRTWWAMVMLSCIGVCVSSYLFHRTEDDHPSLTD